MPHEHLAVSAFVVVHGALNSVFVSLLLILIELSMYSCVAMHRSVAVSHS